jgi:signal transduction histidine kinase
LARLDEAAMGNRANIEEASGEQAPSTVGRLRAQQAALATISQRALAEHSLGALLPEVCALVARALDTRLVSIAQAGANGSLRVVAGVGWRPGVVGRLILPGGRGSMSGYAFQSGAPVVVADFSTEQRFDFVAALREHGAASGMSVRIGGDDAPFGTLNAFTSRAGRFSADDVRFLQAVANVIAGAITRINSEARLRASRRDVTEARAAGLARDAFMGLLSHELRTPITTIYAGAELLEREVGMAHRLDVARDIKAEAERLTRLIEDLLVLTRVERGALDATGEPVLIQRLLPGLVEAESNRFPGLKVELELDDGLPAVRADQTYVEQVLRNLVTNAVRYGRAVELGLTVSAAQQDGAVVVRVLDRGDGFHAGEAERLFELFYRAREAHGVVGGAGIGLFVCRQLIESMGGRMWAQPRDGGGAEFGFALPVIEED